MHTMYIIKLEWRPHKVGDLVDFLPTNKKLIFF